MKIYFVSRFTLTACTRLNFFQSKMYFVQNIGARHVPNHVCFDTSFDFLFEKMKFFLCDNLDDIDTLNVNLIYFLIV